MDGVRINEAEENNAIPLRKMRESEWVQAPKIWNYILNLTA